MRIYSSILFLVFLVITAVSFAKKDLRSIYSRPPAEWPKPHTDPGVQWTELGQLPDSPLAGKMDSLRHIIELGKALFFDPRLSGSGKISCASCHVPEMHWTDQKEKSIGHEGAVNKRNSPSIQNSWFFKRLFWDGRSRDLQDQAFAPINSETEMHSEMHEVMRKLSRVNGYKELFKKAFGDADIDPFRMTEAIAVFEKTVSSRRSRFDEFLAGDKEALTDAELRGLHLFRTKARCINCHHGPLFSDNGFHHSGFANGDAGYFKVTHLDADSGKFKTPSLRDVVFTGPWMHDGKVKSLETLVKQLSAADFPSPGADPLLRKLKLSRKEQKDLLAFLEAISAPPKEFVKPVLPQ